MYQPIFYGSAAAASPLEVPRIEARLTFSNSFEAHFLFYMISPDRFKYDSVAKIGPPPVSNSLPKVPPNFSEVKPVVPATQTFNGGESQDEHSETEEIEAFDNEDVLPSFSITQPQSHAPPPPVPPAPSVKAPSAPPAPPAPAPPAPSYPSTAPPVASLVSSMHNVTDESRFNQLASTYDELSGMTLDEFRKVRESNLQRFFSRSKVSLKHQVAFQALHALPAKQQSASEEGSDTPSEESDSSSDPEPDVKKKGRKAKTTKRPKKSVRVQASSEPPKKIAFVPKVFFLKMYLHFV